MKVRACLLESHRLWGLGIWFTLLDEAKGVLKMPTALHAGASLIGWTGIKNFLRTPEGFYV